MDNRSTALPPPHTPHLLYLTFDVSFLDTYSLRIWQCVVWFQTDCWPNFVGVQLRRRSGRVSLPKICERRSTFLYLEMSWFPRKSSFLCRENITSSIVLSFSSNFASIVDRSCFWYLSMHPSSTDLSLLDLLIFGTISGLLASRPVHSLSSFSRLFGRTMSQCLGWYINLHIF